MLSLQFITPHYLQNGLDCGNCQDVHTDRPKLLREHAVRQDIDQTPMNQLYRNRHNGCESPGVLTRFSLQAKDEATGQWSVWFS